MTGLDKITEKILAEARADAAAINDRASKQCAEIMFAASSDAERIKASLEERAQKEAENMIARAKSSAAMQKRNLILMEKSKAVDSVFEAAYKELLSLPEEKYCELVSKLVAEAITDELETEKTNISLYGEENVDIPEKYELVFNETDKKKLSGEILKGVERIVIGKISRDEISKLTIAEDTVDIDGGVIVRLGSIEINCSLQTVFSLTRERMESEISTMLFEAEENK